jgi:hypothetical protein
MWDEMDQKSPECWEGERWRVDDQGPVESKPKYILCVFQIGDGRIRLFAVTIPFLQRVVERRKWRCVPPLGRAVHRLEIGYGNLIRNVINEPFAAQGLLKLDKIVDGSNLPVTLLATRHGLMYRKSTVRNDWDCTPGIRGPMNYTLVSTSGCT